MDAVTLWAGVQFQAQNGNTDGLLTEAARQGLHLSEVLPCPGGFTARCAAWHYQRLAALARRKHILLRIQAKTGLFFRLRPLLHRTGLWAGILLFVPLLLWLQGFVWTVQFQDLTIGQQARITATLRETVGLMPGCRVTEPLLAAGEYALLQSGEFSWASLNFQDGRLTVEAAAAKPVPEIASGTLHGIRAKAAGTIVRTNLVSGTMLVTPGQQVEAGQGLIGTARSERDGTLVFQPAAGSVQAQFEWSNTQDIPLASTIASYTGERSTHYALLWNGHRRALPSFLQRNDPANKILVRYLQPAIFDLKFPGMVEETTHYFQQEEELVYTEAEALALARLHSLQVLYADYPDAERIARKEAASIAENILHYTVAYTIVAEIGQ